jgi:SAM-dependent methyltransferase
MSVLDVGITDEEFSPADNFLEKHYPYPPRVTALTHESARRFRERYRATKVVLYRGGHFPFKDGAFDVCWSNAVLEHVGDASAQVLFLKEVRRVSRMAFVTTPNRWFPIEVHTRLPLLHYLPKPWFDEILPYLGRGFAAGSYMNLLSLRAVKARLHEAGIRDYRIVKNRLFPFTVDFSVLIRR